MIDSNQTTYDIDNESPGILPNWMFHVFIPALYIFICVFGIIGNGIVIIVTLKCRAAKWVPDAYILNLASADCLFLLGLPFLAYFNSKKQWMFGDFSCRIIMGIDGLNMFTGIFTLTAMSVDRYIAVVHPVWAKTHRTVTTARMVCLGLWTLSGLSSIPLWLYAKTMTFEGETVCNVICSEYIKQIFVIYAFILGFVLPIFAITVSYVNIMKFIVRRTNRVHSGVRIGRVGVMILLAVGLFCICWFPFWITQLRITLTESGTRTKALQVSYFLTTSLTYVNSALNPVVYAYLRHDFRQNIASLWRKHTPSIAIHGSTRKVEQKTRKTQFYLPQRATAKCSSSRQTHVVKN
ncbi:somatostatin receptor type 4-like [Glandiceps talaboti]